MKRGDLHESTRLTRNSLEPCQREQDLDCVGVELHRLGDIALLGSQPLEAARLFRESLAAHERVTTDSASAAFSLACLARALADLRQFESAEDAAQRSLRIRRKLSPSHPDLADSWLALAELAVARKDWTTAEERARTAITGFERYSPENLRLATSSHILGLSLLGQGKQGQALEAFARAVAILEEQRGRGRASVEARAYFATGFAAYYRDYAEALVEAGREADAFHVLEQSRARALLDSLGLRELQFAGDLPDALARERAAQRAEYDRTLARLASLGGDADPAQVERLRGRLRELRDQAEEIGRRIREASPRVASFDEPQPLRLVEAQAALDPGTVLLVFSVHEQRTRLFVVRPPPAANDGLDVHAIAIGTDGLREKVEDFRRLIGRRDLGGRETLQAQAVELYDLILRPADAALASAERLLFVPDGPLHLLPFAALARTDPPGTEGGESQSSFLAEWQPVHIAASATTYSELRRLRPAESVPLSMVAFGDPKYPAMGSTDPATIPDQDLRRAVDRGFTFTPLPASRAEAQAVAALFAPGSALYLGEDATEERAKDLASKARYLHFATHGLLDERSPLDSAIALSMPETQEEGQDNGLLQAWEILDSVRIEADLATLSACDTARGREMGGEGLVGLTRAFQFAGARSVLASLWSVSDASTGRLMQRFYTNLKAGRSKDEALRLAQVDAIRSPDAHPFDWAAFQLFGDWR